MATSKTSSPIIVYWQKDIFLGVSIASIPIVDLNHCRSSSIKLTNAIGVSHIYEASCVMASYSFSDKVSKIEYPLSALSLSISLVGVGYVFINGAFNFLNTINNE